MCDFSVRSLKVGSIGNLCHYAQATLNLDADKFNLTTKIYNLHQKMKIKVFQFYVLTLPAKTITRCRRKNQNRLSPLLKVSHNGMSCEIKELM